MDWLTIQTYIQQHNEVMWMLVGAAFIALEAFGISGIGFFFAGLGALTLGGLMSFNVIYPESIYSQLSWFMGFSIIWTILLWKPLKKIMSSSEKDSFSNIIGTRGTVSGAPLQKGSVGRVRWSGTTMKAQVVSSAKVDTIDAGTDVWIHGIEGNMLLVDVEPVKKTHTD